MPVIDTNKAFFESLYPRVLGYLRESKNLLHRWPAHAN
jgi:hypothetical protein